MYKRQHQYVVKFMGRGTDKLTQSRHPLALIKPFFECSDLVLKLLNLVLLALAHYESFRGHCILSKQKSRQRLLEPRKLPVLRC